MGLLDSLKNLFGGGAQADTQVDPATDSVQADAPVEEAPAENAPVEEAPTEEVTENKPEM